VLLVFIVVVAVVVVVDLFIDSVRKLMDIASYTAREESHSLHLASWT
jgi:hypothetical protein